MHPCSVQESCVLKNNHSGQSNPSVAHWVLFFLFFILTLLSLFIIITIFITILTVLVSTSLSGSVSCSLLLHVSFAFPRTGPFCCVCACVSFVFPLFLCVFFSPLTFPLVSSYSFPLVVQCAPLSLSHTIDYSLISYFSFLSFYTNFSCSLPFLPFASRLHLLLSFSFL